MEFCSECGSRLIQKKVNSGNQALIILVCTKCKFKKHETDNTVKTVGKIIEHPPKQFVAVMERRTTIQSVTNNPC